MMSPQMIQQLLIESDLNENELSQRLFVPCLQKMNMVMGQRFRDIKFVGGTSEQGNDIEFYEVVGPDRHKVYTGIQVKKGNISQTHATTLTTQGTQAFEKSILDLSTGHKYRLGRWVIAITGNIKPAAKEYIHTQLEHYGKQISFWDGIHLSQMLLDYYYDELVLVLNVDQRMAESQNGRLTIFDPQEPIILKDNFSSTEWTDINLSHCIPSTSADTIYLAVIPLNQSPRSIINVGVKSSVDDIVIDSITSQVNLHPIRISQGEVTCKVKLLQACQSVQIVCRGFRFFI